MNIIKISEQVFETIQNNDILPIEKEHLPYNTICIAFPYSFLRSSDEMIDDAIKELKVKANQQGIGLKKMLEDRKQEIEEQQRKIINYCNSDLHVIFNINNFEITVKHSRPQIIGVSEQVLFHGVKAFEFVPMIKVNQMSDNGIWFYNTMVKLVSGVIYAINNMNIEVTETTENIKSNSNRPTKTNNEKIRYISNIKYLNSTITDGQSTSHEKRIFNMEAWEVRGHWRHYQNGSKIWVNAYVKGDKEKLRNSDNIYKLNKIDID
jgi:hypothetical protein